MNILRKIILLDKTEEIAWNKMSTRVNNNLAVCFNKINKPFKACIACNNVPEPTSKTYFNHGRALLSIGEYRSAIEKLKKALALEPNNKEILNELHRASKKDTEFYELEKSMWSRNKGEPKKEQEQSPLQEFCENFLRETNLIRQPIPEGLSPNEYKEIRKHALALGILFVDIRKHGRTIFYLQKPFPDDKSLQQAQVAGRS